MKRLDIFGTLMMLAGNIALITSVSILLSVDFHIEMFHIIALVTGVVGITTTVLSYVIALLVGGEEINQEEE